MRPHILAVIAAAATISAGAVAVRAPDWPAAFAAPRPAPSCTGKAAFGVAPFHDARPQLAHAVSAVLLRDGRLRAVWYQGRKELSPDARIWTATFDGTHWSKARPILGPAEATAGSGRFVRTVGNPLLFRNSRGELVLLFANIGVIGGWSGVNLKVTHSRDEGATWSPPRQLTTSPVFNMATNVRGPALPVAGGRFTLVPAYSEFGADFPELVLLDNDDRIVGKRRIGIRHRGLQPFIVATDSRHAVAFMRARDGFTLLSRTADAGNSWTAPIQTSEVNNDVPVVVTPIGRELLMVTSRLDKAASRWVLVFAVSRDAGMTWRDIFLQPLGAAPNEIPKYPFLLVGADGLYHVLFSLVYGSRGSVLMHAWFSRDWIAEQEGVPCR
jgi:predicted neuraminidase